MSCEPEFVRLGAAAAPAWLTSDAVKDAVALEAKPFSADEFDRRVTLARVKLAERELDAILVFRPSSVDYLCGHHTIETASQPLLLTRALLRLYVPDPEVGRALASSNSPSIGHYAASEDALELIAGDVARVCGASARIAVEDRDATVPPRILSLLQEHRLRVEPGMYLVEQLRLLLSSEEIECVERAARLTRRGAEAAVEAAGAPGVTDSTLAASIGEALRAGADSSAAMDVIVATGARGGVPHSTFIDLPLDNGTTFVEFAGTHQRYHAPLMVTVARQIDDEARRLERLSQTMLAAVLREVRPGRAASDVAAAVRHELVLDDRDIFHFNFGYAIGLAHPPGWLDGAPFSIVAENEAELLPGMAFHIPASFRSFARRGVGLSHTILLEGRGPRLLTGAETAGIASVA